MRSQNRTELIPSDWNAEQAFAVYALLREITEIIWQQYRRQIIESVRPHCAPDEHQQRTVPVPMHCDDDDDSMPF